MASGELTPDQIAYQMAHAHETKQPMIYGVCALYVVVDSIIVGLRLYARRISKVRLASDDYFIIAALFFTWLMATEIIISSVYGIGRHAITLDMETAKKMSKAMFAFEATFPFLNTSIKLSILMLYRRVFGVVRYFRVMWYINLFWTIGVFTALSATLWSQCKPISDFWNLEKGHVCRMPFAASLAANIANAIGDFGLMILPLPPIIQLQMSKKKRAGVAGIFLLGSSVLVVSALRVPMLKHGTTDTDSSWSTVEGILLSFAEPAIGIICACLPVMWPLFKRTVNAMSTKGGSGAGSKATENWSAGKTGQWSALEGEERRGQSDIKTTHSVDVSYSMNDLRDPR